MRFASEHGGGVGDVCFDKCICKFDVILTVHLR